MNVELKDFVDIAIDLYKEDMDLSSKSYWKAFMDALTLLKDVPLAIKNFSDIQAEITALPGSSQQADLIAYIETRFEEVGTLKAQLILNVTLKIVGGILTMIQNGIALKNVIES